MSFSTTTMSRWKESASVGNNDGLPPAGNEVKLEVWREMNLKRLKCFILRSKGSERKDFFLMFFRALSHEDRRELVKKSYLGLSIF